MVAIFASTNKPTIRGNQVIAIELAFGKVPSQSHHRSIIHQVLVATRARVSATKSKRLLMGFIDNFWQLFALVDPE